ncbi:acyl-CoA dehydrogenase family protein, partial [Ascidiaceihabitans sp.]|nr:acyl-CoA dehydrogenase family protein [Ascidiaceihabitans sp.]
MRYRCGNNASPRETSHFRSSPSGSVSAPNKPDLGSFDWADAFRLSGQLSEDERMIQASAAAYASEKLAPRVIDAFANEVTDRSIFSEMGEMGLLGVTLPEE